MHLETCVDEGQTIVDFDDQSNSVYFLLSGDVRILLRTPGGKEFILADLRAGEVFGELSAIDGKLAPPMSPRSPRRLSAWSRVPSSRQCSPVRRCFPIG